jgi:hypothetical protein
MNVRTWLGHILLNIGFWTFVWGAFELATIWLGTFEFPIPNYYIIGAILAYISYILITFSKSLREKNQKPNKIQLTIVDSANLKAHTQITLTVADT